MTKKKIYKGINYRFYDKKTHKKFNHKLLDDDLSFQSFVDQAINDYLEGSYNPKEDDK